MPKLPRFLLLNLLLTSALLFSAFSPAQAAAPSQSSADPLEPLAHEREDLLHALPQERLMFVHTARGRFDIDLSLAAIEASLGTAFLRVHRQWLVHTAHVRAIENADGETLVVVGDEPARELRVPVARDRKVAV